MPEPSHNLAAEELEAAAVLLHGGVNSLALGPHVLAGPSLLVRTFHRPNGPCQGHNNLTVLRPLQERHILPKDLMVCVCAVVYASEVYV